MLVNESSKAIEAFSMSARCGTGGAATIEDALQNPPGASLHPLDQHLHTIGRVAPGKRDLTDFHLDPQPSGCQWVLRVGAMLYADGTFVGSSDDAEAIQSRRQGIRDGLLFWTKQTLSAELPEAWISAARIAARERKAEDEGKQMFPACGQRPIKCAYWRGRTLADSYVVNHLRADRDAEEKRKRLGAVMETWLTSFDNDLAYAILRNRFPNASK